MSKSYRKTPEGNSKKKFPTGYKRKRRHDDHRALRELTRHGGSNTIDVDDSTIDLLEDDDVNIYIKEDE